jgi:hypothetical protein
MSAQDALGYGIVDSILEPERALGPAANGRVR